MWASQIGATLGIPIHTDRTQGMFCLRTHRPLSRLLCALTKLTFWSAGTHAVVHRSVRTPGARYVHRWNAQCSPSAHTVSMPPTGTPFNWWRICRRPHVSNAGIAHAPCIRCDTARSVRTGRAHFVLCRRARSCPERAAHSPPECQCAGCTGDESANCASSK